MTQQALRARAYSEARLAVLRAMGPEPLSSAEIAQRVGFTTKSVREELNALLILGKVEREVISEAGPRWHYVWWAKAAAAEQSGGDRH